MKTFLAEAWKMGGLWDFLKRVVPYFVAAAGGSRRIATMVGAAVLSGMVVLAGKVGVEIPVEVQLKLLDTIMWVAMTGLAALGAGDLGKEKAALELEKEKVAAETVKAITEKEVK
mgnify:CR=1 FL=1